MVAGVVAAAGALGACATEPSPDRPRAVELGARDFLDETFTAARPAAAASDAGASRPTLEAADVTVEPGGPEGAVAASAMRPEPAPPIELAASDVEERLAVDQLVGQINGVPVYANEFFRDMDARLRAEAQRQSLERWLPATRQDIQRKLVDTMRDELLLAEFQTSLTPQQRVGVLAFIDDIRNNIRRGLGGSEQEAESSLLDSENMTLDEYVRSLAERQFILQQLRKELSNRVQVSFREVQRYYERNVDEFVPAPVASLRIIRVTGAAGASRVESALASGEPFAEVAARESAWRPDAGNLHEVEVDRAGLAATTFFRPEELNGAAASLSPGESAGPIELGSSTWWIRLDEVRREPGQTLYEAQREIEQRLRAQKLQEEEQRYFAELLERSSVTEVPVMVDRLLRFAAERYYAQPLVTESAGS